MSILQDSQRVTPKVDEQRLSSSRSNSPRLKIPIDKSYMTTQYWMLPKNVRTAIDNAKMKSQHSEFFYKLQDLNDKIVIYRSIFYN